MHIPERAVIQKRSGLGMCGPGTPHSTVTRGDDPATLFERDPARRGRAGINASVSGITCSSLLVRIETRSPQRETKVILGPEISWSSWMVLPLKLTVHWVDP